jgi:hypothetical protein
MDSQNPDDWKLSLSQLPEDPFQSSQPSTSRRRVRDEAEPSERRVQPRSDPSPRQLSFVNLQPDAKALVIVLEAEAILTGGHQLVFEGCFSNTNEGQMVSRYSNEVGHRLWLQEPLTYLSNEQRSSFISVMLHQILEFLYV